MVSATPSPTSTDRRVDELRRQVDVLVAKGYPALAGMPEQGFRDLARPLEPMLDRLPPPSSDSSLPFVLVVSRRLVSTADAMDRVVNGKGKAGFIGLDPLTPDHFSPVAGTDVPAAALYLIADVDLGARFLDVRPRDALTAITSAGRTPLTIGEGIAVLTQFVDALATHNAFQLLASRGTGKHIPSLWNSGGRPRLGWCWDGAPHPWMGSGSAAVRLAVD